MSKNLITILKDWAPIPCNGVKKDLIKRVKGEKFTAYAKGREIYAVTVTCGYAALGGYILSLYT